MAHRPPHPWRLAADGQRQQHIAVAEVQRLQLKGAQVIIIRLSLPLGHRRRLPTGNQPHQRVFTFRRIVADRLNGRPARSAGANNDQAPSPAYRRGGDINQPGDIRQTGADRLRYLLIILMQHRQHIGGGEAIDVGGLRVTTSLH